MRSDARLDSVVFQLTPTRTRFDLVLIANGRKEKFASGLLKPFVAHLKAAQDQIAKGGYSITLEPSSGFDVPWFTRGTVERFVRFVSTPEVLERVRTLESEILQLEDAIAIQSNDSLGLKSVEDHGRKLTESNGGSMTPHQPDCFLGGLEWIELFLPFICLTCHSLPYLFIYFCNMPDTVHQLIGGRANYDPDSATAIVVYKPGSNPTPQIQNETAAHEENSKVQLLRVLETRKTMLRKEQAMAFARAVAAGFDIDNLGYLIAFAERFGAARLM
ncbi:COP1-interacting protein-related [Zea mays]|nr:COP1-interacting protein-related [Zea mays]ONM53147.1 COP1-interacting protein-related [Zea mays]ONM53151.1 COP1-interacting protein-related [Zea mays]